MMILFVFFCAVLLSNIPPSTADHDQCIDHWYGAFGPDGPKPGHWCKCYYDDFDCSGWMNEYSCVAPLGDDDKIVNSPCFHDKDYEFEATTDEVHDRFCIRDRWMPAGAKSIAIVGYGQQLGVDNFHCCNLRNARQLHDGCNDEPTPRPTRRPSPRPPTRPPTQSPNSSPVFSFAPTTDCSFDWTTLINGLAARLPFNLVPGW